MSDSSDRDMQRADIANGEGDPEAPERAADPASPGGRDDGVVPPQQDPEAGYPTSTGVVDDEEAELPPLGQELEAD